MNDKIRAFERKQLVISFLGLLIILGLSIISNTLHMQSVADQNTRFVSRMVTLGDFREVSSTLEEARLSSFLAIHYRSTLEGKSFTLPAIEEIKTHKSLWEKISRDQITVPVSDSLSSTEPDSITFEYFKFNFVGYGFFIWLVLVIISIPQTRYMKRNLQEQFKKDLNSKLNAAKIEITRDVRHNLRTPLAALLRIPNKLANVEDKILLESIIKQMKSLITKLDDRESIDLSEQSSDDLYDSILNSKNEILLSLPEHINLQFEISDEVASALVSHIPYELRAILGNIVNNAIDAIGSKPGIIKLNADDLGDKIEISIADNGKGISSENLPQVFDKGASFEKTNGTGYGLFHAKTWIQKWNGSITINSISNKETTVKITLPINDRASWYLPRLKLNSKTKIIVLEDQEPARNLWKSKFQENNILDQSFLVSNIKSFNSLSLNFESPDFVFLFDYDLTGEQTGLDLLKSLPKDSTRVLVTGHFDLKSLRDECSRLSISLLPKSLISDLRFVIKKL